MMEDCKQWEPFFSIEEPEVDVFAHELLRRVKARRSPVFPLQDPSEWFKNKTVADIKAILFQLHRRTIPLLTSKPLSDIFKNSRRTPLPDPARPFPGIYVGAFLDGGVDGMNLRDAIRLANILKDSRKLERVIAPHKMEKGTRRGAKLVGEAWKRTLEEMSAWMDLDGFAEMEDEDEVLEQPCPKELLDDRYNELFPFSPIYTGYSKHPDKRYRQHIGSIFPCK